MMLKLLLLLALLLRLLPLDDVVPVVVEEQHSEAIPLERAESKLLFSDDGVRAGLLDPLGSELEPRFELMMLSVFGGTLLTPENLLDVSMSMSA